MRITVTADLVGELARTAGFDFSAERCQALADQLQWMLAEASRIPEFALGEEEPALVVGAFQADCAATDPEAARDD